MDPMSPSSIEDARPSQFAAASPDEVPILEFATPSHGTDSGSRFPLTHVSDDDLERAGRHYRRSLEAHVFARLPTSLAAKLERHLARGLAMVEQELVRRSVAPHPAAEPGRHGW